MYSNIGCNAVESGKTMPKMVLNCALKRKQQKRKPQQQGIIPPVHPNCQFAVLNAYFIVNLEIETRFVHFLTGISKVFVHAPPYPRN